MNKMRYSFLLIICVWLFLHLLFRPTYPKKRFVIAHRGASFFAPENTLSSVLKAIKLNAKYIEIDIQRTKDNALILMHDKSVDRTTNGTGFVYELVWETIQSLEIESSDFSLLKGETIPKLDYVLGNTRDRQIVLVIEVKKPDMYPGIENQLLTSLQKINAIDEVVIISFNHAWLEELGNLEPKISTGKLSFWAGPIQKSSNTKLIDVHWTNIIFDPSLIYRSNQLGYQTVVWTVNNEYLMRLMLWLGADGITTDRLDIWNRVISEYDKYEHIK